MSNRGRASITLTVAHEDDRFTLHQVVTIGTVGCSPRNAAIKSLAKSCASLLRRALVAEVEAQGGKVLLQGPSGETVDVTRI